MHDVLRHVFLSLLPIDRKGVIAALRDEIHAPLSLSLPPPLRSTALHTATPIGPTSDDKASGAHRQTPHCQRLRLLAQQRLRHRAHGAAVIAITNPLDCLKQRWQVEPGARPQHFCWEIVQREGLVQGLWKPESHQHVRVYHFCRHKAGVVSCSSRCRDSAGQARGGFGMFVSGLSEARSARGGSHFSWSRALHRPRRG